MGKEIEEFRIEGAEFRVDTSVYSRFARGLVHLFRNAIDHGIESPDERVKNGKSEDGKISCAAALENGAIAITVSDDGRGIDVKRLIQKAEELNIKIPENPLMLVFENALSTQEGVSQLSGRGIGLGALKEEAKKLGGNIEVSTEIGRKTTFRCIIPAQNGTV